MSYLGPDVYTSYWSLYLVSQVSYMVIGVLHLHDATLTRLKFVSDANYAAELLIWTGLGDACGADPSAL